jgi:hypothetical protein
LGSRGASQGACGTREQPIEYVAGVGPPARMPLK